MKKIYLIGFRGTGFRDKRYVPEPALIRAGHVGLAFEGDEKRIFGFHPTAQSMARFGSEDEVFSWLRARNTLEGTR